jgi:NAD(P)-dependent dehydrogenase (short-subunit alcohol dehydrogenase family)
MTSFDGSTTADEVVASLDVSGLRVVITGATSGIGFETARALAAGGAAVTIGGRDDQRTDHSADRIRSAHPEASVETLVMDLASQGSIRRAAEAIQGPIDVLICNAGIVAGSFGTTEEGIERTVGVCHVGHFLLTHVLLRNLETGGGGRVVVVASESHRSPAHLDFDRLPLSDGNYSQMLAYGQAKLCNVLFAHELDRRMGDRGVHANSLHPGTMISTGIGRDWWLGRLAILASKPFTRSVAQAAATSCYVAASPELEGVGGRYFDKCAERQASREACDPRVAARLWEISEEWAQLEPGERLPG